MSNNKMNLSRQLSKTLRHKAVVQGLHIRSDGFVMLSDVLANKLFLKYSTEDVIEVVQDSDKQRFEIKDFNGEKYIRAVQGHTIKSIVDEDLLTLILSPEEVPICVHGTYTNSIDSIIKTGLNRMSRNHIHMAVDLPNGKAISGARRDVEVLIFIDMKNAMAAGVQFFRSKNNVILSPGPIPSDFFSEIRYIDLKNKISLKKDYFRADVETTSSNMQHCADDISVQNTDSLSKYLMSKKWKRRTEDTHKSLLMHIAQRGAESFDTLLFGDSMLERWKTSGKDFVFGSNVLNAGCGGDTIQNMIWRLCASEQTADCPANPTGLLDTLPNIKRVVLLAGTNNLPDHKMSSLEMSRGVATLIEGILRCQPLLEAMYVHAVPFRIKIKRTRVEGFNQLLKEMCETDSRLHYCDFLTGFGEPDSAAASAEARFEGDGVHLSGVGYHSWFAVLSSQVCLLEAEEDQPAERTV